MCLLFLLFASEFLCNSHFTYLHSLPLTVQQLTLSRNSGLTMNIYHITQFCGLEILNCVTLVQGLIRLQMSLKAEAPEGLSEAQRPTFTVAHCLRTSMLLLAFDWSPQLLAKSILSQGCLSSGYTHPSHREVNVSKGKVVMSFVA